MAGMQVLVELGDVVTSLGDRVWATWFAASTTSQSSQNVTPLGTACIPLAVRLVLRAQGSPKIELMAYIEPRVWGL